MIDSDIISIFALLISLASFIYAYHKDKVTKKSIVQLTVLESIEKLIELESRTNNLEQKFKNLEKNILGKYLPSAISSVKSAVIQLKSLQKECQETIKKLNASPPYKISAVNSLRSGITQQLIKYDQLEKSFDEFFSGHRNLIKP